MEQTIPQTIPELFQYLQWKFSGIDSKFKDVDSRFDRIEQKLDHHGELFMVIQDELHRNTVRVGALERALLR